MMEGNTQALGSALKGGLGRTIPPEDFFGEVAKFTTGHSPKQIGLFLAIRTPEGRVCMLRGEIGAELAVIKDYLDYEARKLLKQLVEEYQSRTA
jgi:hypothetical protein